MGKVHVGDKLQASHVWQVGGRESGWMVGWEVAQMLVVKSEKRMVLLMNATATRANVCSQTFFSRGCVIMNRQPPTTLPWTTSGDVYIRRTSRSRGMPSVLIIEATRIKWFLHETNWERTKTENEIRILAWGGEESQRERERKREREREKRRSNQKMESNPCIVEPGQCIEEDVRFRFPCNVVERSEGRGRELKWKYDTWWKMILSQDGDFLVM